MSDQDGEEGVAVRKSRARDSEAAVPREERVRTIMSLMATRSRPWESKRDAAPLMSDWDCAYQTIESYAAEASRRLRQLMDPVQIRVECYDQLRESASVLRDAKATADSAGDLAKIAAEHTRLGNTWAEIGGIKPRPGASVSVSVSQGGGQDRGAHTLLAEIIEGEETPEE